MTQNKKNAVVIGCGFGGLATAIRLQAKGVEVTLLEKRDKAGGRAYVYEDQGFKFDAGPTVITAPETIEELFQVSQKKQSDYVTLLPVTPFYRLFWEDGYKFDYSNDVKKLFSQIEAKSPNDAKGYEEFLKYSEKVYNEGYTKLAHVPFLNWWSMIRVSPELIKLKAYRSVYKTIASFIKDKHLRQAFSFHSLLVGGNPFKTSSIYTLIHYLERKGGVFFPKGGTGALVRGLVKLFQDKGGKLVLNAEVEEIVTENGKVSGVRIKSGETYKSETVICNSDVGHTYLNLLKKTPEANTSRKKINRARFSMSLFVIYFGTKKTYPEMAHHNVIFGPRYKELLDDIFEKGILADDFSLYLHAPTRTDTDMAPKDSEAFYVLSPVPHLQNAPIDWKVEGPRYADRILSYLEKHYLPDLKKNIVTQRIFTPENFVTDLNSLHGSAFSLEPLLTQSAFFRIHNRDDSIEGLYFVGAGTHPGAGVPGVLNSAKATAGLVLEDLQIK